MNTSKFTILLFCAIGLIFSACSVEKRVHMSGYHVDWKVNRNAKLHKVDKDTETIANQDLKVVEELLEDSSQLISKAPLDLSKKYEESSAERNQVLASSAPLNESDQTVAEEKHIKRGFVAREEVKAEAKNSNTSHSMFSSAFAIAGFVLALLGLLTSGPSALVLGILAVVFSVIALQRGGGRGLAIAGLIIGIVDIVFALGVFSIF